MSRKNVILRLIISKHKIIRARKLSKFLQKKGFYQLDEMMRLTTTFITIDKKSYLFKEFI